MFSIRVRLRFFRKTGIYLSVPFILDRRRRQVARLEQQLESAPEEVVQVGNYRLRLDALLERPVVYSAGVGNNVEFELALLKHRPEATLVLCDPTPRTRTFMEKHPIRNRVRYLPVGLSEQDGELELYSDSKKKEGFETAYSLSVFRRGYDTENIYKAAAWRLGSVMKEAGHDFVDVLKMDIEGSAAGVLRDMLRSRLLPTQIACEIEAPPRHEMDLDRFCEEVRGLLGDLKDAGYILYNIRDERHKKGRSLELLAFRGTDRPDGKMDGEERL